MNLPNYQDFEQCLNTEFKVIANDDVIEELTLIEVTSTHLSAGNTSSQASDQGHQSFSLIFEGKKEGHYPQMTYSMMHDVLHQFDLFIVPIGPSRETKKMRYQAVFG